MEFEPRNQPPVTPVSPFPAAASQPSRPHVEGADPALVWDQPPQRSGPNPLVIALAVGGLALGGFGVVRGLLFPSKPTVQVIAPAQPSFFSEQAKMMREALDMAKEAQQLQREHMQFMQEEVQAAYEGERFDSLGAEDGGGD